MKGHPSNGSSTGLKGFAKNPIIVQAGVMGEAYGTPPDTMLNADLTPAERFWFNNDVWAATRKFERTVKQQNAGGTAGRESQELASEQEQRAAQADDPAAPEEQIEALERVQEIRQMQGNH